MSFFRYPGGKSKLLFEILPQLSKFQASEYREPFFGGGSVGLEFIRQNPKIKKIWINDKDIGIAALWTSVIRYSEKLIAKIINFKPTIDDFYSCKDTLLSLERLPDKVNDLVDISFFKLLMHQISYSGLGTKSGGPLGGKEQKSQYKIDCRWSPVYICKEIRKLNERFRTIKVHGDGCTNFDFSVLLRDQAEEILIYLDPPYYVKGEALYQHFFTENDHDRLCLHLKETKHKWVLSYDACDSIRQKYNWANLREIDVRYTIKLAQIKKPKTELLIFG